ncbi:MAG: hypothetical protein V1859_00070 [archaeon]
MRYNKIKFDSAVRYYKKYFSTLDAKNVFIYGLFSENAFLSIAPLSKAAHEFSIDLHVSFTDSKQKIALFDVWNTYDELKSGKKKECTALLSTFINYVDTKSEGKFKKIFNRPGLIIRSDEDSFIGKNYLEYQSGWLIKEDWKRIEKCAAAIIKNVINPKKNEIFGISFPLLPKEESEDSPLSDYIDAYCLSLCTAKKSVGKYKVLQISSSTQRKSMLEPPEPVSDLITTILGCELSKEVDEPIFKIYKKLSSKLYLSRITPANAVFGVRGKGYSGRHYFGELIGYPTPNNKTRWDSPASMLYKFSWYPQSANDSRLPQSRTGFTSTVPLDILMDAVLVDYKKMRARNKKITDELSKCNIIIVKGNIENSCDFEIGLVKKDGSRRRINNSDSDARNLIHPEFAKEGKNFGMMANIPGGEAYTTPEYVKGKIVGDVVISLDKSYMLSAKHPIVIVVNNNKYKLIGGEKRIIEKILEKRKESWEKIIIQEKNNSIPSEIIELKKKNFDSIGEFAINTNPKARLCNYLIVNEKIANMIHVALGSGFEPDKATEYHSDIVIDAPRQKLDIFGLDENKKEYWILKKGKFVI